MYKQPRKQQVKCHPMILAQNLHIPKNLPKDLYSLLEGPVLGGRQDNQGKLFQRGHRSERSIASLKKGIFRKLKLSDFIE